METLFWKVFRNKYLINLIFCHMNSDIDDVFGIKYNIDERFNFQDINSLEWMLSRNQYSILKYKIKIENEYIRITKKSIKSLFNGISSCGGSNGGNSRKEEHLEILLLLLKYKREAFEIFDLTKLAVKYNCIEALTVLTNEPFSIIVYPSTLEFALTQASSLIVLELLNINQRQSTNTTTTTCSLITEEIKLKSFELAFKNLKYLNEMVSLILDNPILFSQDCTQLKIKKLKISDEGGNTTTLNKFNITSKELFKLNCSNTKSRLLELKMVEPQKFTLLNWFSMNQPIEYVINLLELYFQNGIDQHIAMVFKNYINSSNGVAKETRLKELRKLVLINYNSYTMYREYLLKYHESIDIYHNDTYSLDKIQNQQELKFITFFRILEKFGVHQNIKKVMVSISNGKLEYDDGILNLFSTDKKGLLKIQINDIKQFKWIHCLNEFMGIFPYKLISMKYLFIKSIKECSIDKFEYLDQLPNKSKFKSFKLTNKKLELPSSVKDTLKLIEFFGSTSFNSFDNCLVNGINVFFSKVIEQVPPHLSNGIPHSLTNIGITKINSLQLFYHLKNNNFKLTQFYFENSDVSHFFTFVAFERQLNSSLDELFRSQSSLLVYDNSNFNENEFKSLIKSLISKFKHYNGGMDKETKSIEKLLIYYYQVLISNTLNMELVIETHQMLIENSIIIQQSFFNSFFYLKIRSLKLFGYLISRPHIDEFFKIENIHTLQQIPGNHIFNLKQYLQPLDLFSFDEILSGGSNTTTTKRKSFNEILVILVNKLSIEICTTVLPDYDFFTNSLNEDLLYFVKIKRLDLFFGHLKFIQLHIDKANENSDYDLGDSFPFLSTTYQCPHAQLLTTSKLFSRHQQQQLPVHPPIIKRIENNTSHDTTFSPPYVVIANSFKFSDVLIKSAVRVMDLEAIQLFIEHFFYKYRFVQAIYDASIYSGRFEISTFIFENFSIEIFNLPMYALESKQKDNFNNYHQEFKYMVTNYHGQLDPIKFRSISESINFILFKKRILNLFVEYLIMLKNRNVCINFISYSTGNGLNQKKDEIISLLDTVIPKIYDIFMYGKKYDNGSEADEEDLKEEMITKIIYKEDGLFKLYMGESILKFKQDRDNQTNQYELDYINQTDNLFLYPFIFGDIKLCTLILQYYPNKFKITKESIELIIKENRIHIIKYFYNQDNCIGLINNFQNDKDLYNHLIIQLNNHIDYKYNLNWLEQQ